MKRARGRTILFACAALLVVAVLSDFAARRPIDFRVYYATAHALAAGNMPLYGPMSGILWPQIYRYPPLFLLLFFPFSLLPYKLSAAVWAAGKFVVLYFLARALFVRLEVNGALARLLAVLPATAYLAVEFHYGNVQFYIFGLVALALLWVKDRPVPAALALALGISLKAWPLFFVPYCVALGYRRFARWTLGFTLGLTLIPALFFGPQRYARLLKEWGTQEFGVASTAGEPGIVGFPSQSLHSVMMRYFVSLDYSKLTDPHYPKYNLAALDSRVVELAWVVLDAAGYAGLLLIAWLTTRREKDGDQQLILHGIAFCGYVLLQPFSQNGDFVVLVWPTIVAAGLLYHRGALSPLARAALSAALSLMIVEALLPGAPVRRALQVLGSDFWLTSLLAAGLLAAVRVAPDRQYAAGVSKRCAPETP